MPQYPNIETEAGYKTLLSSHQEQRDYAARVDKDSLYCLLPHPQGWFVEMVVDNRHEADSWWEKQKHARVHYGQSGKLRNAK